MIVETTSTTISNIKLSEKDLYEAIKDLLIKKGIENTDRHMVIKFDRKRLENHYDEDIAQVTITKIEKS